MVIFCQINSKINVLQSTAVFFFQIKKVSYSLLRLRIAKMNNCLNRMDGKDDDTVKNDDGRNTISEKVELFGTNSSPVRSEIKDIIEEKINQKDTNVGSHILEKVVPNQLGGSDHEVELEEASGQETPEKAKILFSLKDFFERSKESDNSADHLSSGEDQESDNASSDLDEKLSLCTMMKINHQMVIIAMIYLMIVIVIWKLLKIPKVIIKVTLKIRKEMNLIMIQTWNLN